MSYNYAHFKSAEYSALPEEGGLPLGSSLPSVSLKNTNGDSVDLRNFLGRPLVLQTGSITCPLYVGSISAMNDLARKYSSANFVVVYIREAHPGGRIGPHQSEVDKCGRAKEVLQAEPEHRRVLVDGLDGEFHRALGSFPNMGFVFDAAGELVFRSDWLQAGDIDRVLTGLAAGRDSFEGPSAFRPVSPGVTLRVLNRAGTGAKRDFFRGVPKIALGHVRTWWGKMWG